MSQPPRNRAERRAAGQRGPVNAPQPIKAQRVVYGANCSWWDTIDKAGRHSTGLPCCPSCGSVLFEIPNENDWWEQVDDHARMLDDPQYRSMIEWMRGKCFPDFASARSQYALHKATDHDG